MKIGNFDLNSTRTLIIAELSANHGNSIEIAKETIRAAKKAGADAIKLQTYTADTLTLNCDKEDFVVKGGTLWEIKLSTNSIMKPIRLGSGIKSYLNALKKRVCSAFQHLSIKAPLIF